MITETYHRYYPWLAMDEMMAAGGEPSNGSKS